MIGTLFQLLEATLIEEFAEILSEGIVEFVEGLLRDLARAVEDAQMVVLSILTYDMREQGLFLQLLYLLHLNCPAHQLLHRRSPVLERSMIQASREVPPELLLDVVDLLLLLVLLVLEPIVQELSQSDQLLLLDVAALAQVLLVNCLPELAVPVEPMRIEAVRWELETRLLGLRHRIEFDEDLAHDSVTALDVVDLSRTHEEVILRLVDVLLILVS